MDIIQQIINKISQTSNILIIVSGGNVDSLAAGLGLRTFLKKLDKETILLSFTELGSRFEFLPEIGTVVRQIDLHKNFVIDVSTQKTGLDELSYKSENDRLSIFLKPKSGQFSASDVSFRSSNFPFGLLILIGVPSLEILGEFYNQNAPLFFETPIVNIDFRATNENYGQFNLVDLTNTSSSETVLDLIQKFEPSLIDENIATQLLAGIIAETDSFQHVRTTPKIFLKASELVSLGAHQQEIISNLYKTKSLGLLKLWGRVLARLKQQFDNILVYSAINGSDLEKSEASEEDANAIITEMVSQLGFAKIFVFLKEENPNLTTVFCHTNLSLDLNLIFQQFTSQLVSVGTVKFIVPQSVVAAEKTVLEVLKTEVDKIKTNF
jgi:nanoRNase/pAp phosphatase (c-di-AMP/oligoRNAs hydrolase)